MSELKVGDIWNNAINKEPVRIIFIGETVVVFRYIGRNEVTESTLSKEAFVERFIRFRGLPFLNKVYAWVCTSGQTKGMLLFGTEAPMRGGTWEKRDLTFKDGNIYIEMGQ
jgi:hypothetical protein